MDPVIENEMKDHIYLDVPEFFATFFDSVGGLPHLVDGCFCAVYFIHGPMECIPVVMRRK
jgi:hypothetical protein